MAMPERQSGPPTARAARDVIAPAKALDAANLQPGADAAVMLRRRRAAAWRLPLLGDGRRDPLDQFAGLPVRAPQRCGGAEFGPGGWRPCCRAGAA